MRNLEKYKGILPAFYACYDDNGDVSPERVEALTQYFVDKGVKGIYVNGSSGECIYLDPQERMTILEHVMRVAKGKLTVICHVACNNTRGLQDPGSPCREVRRGRHRLDSPDLLPPAGVRHRPVLE
jgi:N-acetylneuraminate lyase